MTRLAGKVAVVTGAARMRGIGRAIALRLAEEGADVVVTGRSAAPSSFPADERTAGWRGIDSVVAEIEAIGQRALAVYGDVTVQADVDRLAKATVDTFGRLDILVNNAALPSDAGAAPILDMDEAVWVRTVDVNLNGVYRVTRACGRCMRDLGHGGAIVNVSSTAGRVGLPAYGAYCATKFAVVGFTQQLALELAPYGIRVNCICPGSTDTDMMDGTIGRTARVFGTQSDTVRSRIKAQIPMGRQGEVEEQAAAVAFLASADASYITGQTLNVDGGLRFD